jgi:hypothetical protein
MKLMTLSKRRTVLMMMTLISKKKAIVNLKES